MPRWYENSENASLPDTCRVRCLDCRGRGSHAGAALETCHACHEQPMACPQHTCKTCAGSGLVCPYCRGQRFVRKQDVDVANNWVVEIERCGRCWDSAAKKINTAKERHAIDRYLVRWRYEQGQPVAAAAAEVTPPSATPAAMEPLDLALQQSREQRTATYQPPHGHRPPPLPPFKPFDEPHQGGQQRNG